MKKSLFIIVLIFALLLSAFEVQAGFGIKLYINNREVKCDVAPMIVNDRTLVPARVVFENLKAEVDWDATSRRVFITSGDKSIVFKIGSTQAVINDNPVVMDCAPLIVDDRTMVPIRFVSENLGYTVNWDGTAKKVSINAPDIIPEPEMGYEVISVSVKENISDNQVLIALSEGNKPKVMTLKEPFRICLDFENAKLGMSDGKQIYDNGYVSQVRWALHDDYTRIVIECPGEQPYKISGEDTSAIVVTVGNKYSAVLPEADEPETDNPSEQLPENPTVPDNSTDSSQKPEKEEPEAIVKPVVLTNIVVIDAGHGGKDVGAVAKDEEGNMIIDEEGNPVLTEKDLNLYISRKIRDYLTADGVKVVMTRDDDSYSGTELENLLARANLANNVDASLFVSIHNNSAISPKANGTEVCYTPTSSGAYGTTSMDFAQNILGPLVEASGLTNRGLSSRPNLAVLKYTKMPAVLIECGFLTNEGDRAVLMDRTKLDAMAKAVAEGIKTTMKQMNKK